MASTTYRIAIVGLGKIARDQHIPCIQGDPRFQLAATASTSGSGVDGVPGFRSLTELLRDGPPVDAVALLTPPGVRPGLALEAIAAGKAVLLEKPPAATFDAFEEMRGAAERKGVTLFATWHARFNAAVEEARKRLAGQRLTRLRIDWKEDVRHWHPGQDWVWTREGFGVLDPGINAFSIATAIIDGPLGVRSAALQVPAGRESPIAAEVVFDSPVAAGPEALLQASLDWRQQGEQIWRIEVTTEAGDTLRLDRGGTRLSRGGDVIVEAPSREYEAIYAHFAALLDGRESDVDGAPLRLALDALDKGERQEVAAFEW